MSVLPIAAGDAASEITIYTSSADAPPFESSAWAWIAAAVAAPLLAALVAWLRVRRPGAPDPAWRRVVFAGCAVGGEGLLQAALDEPAFAAAHAFFLLLAGAVASLVGMLFIGTADLLLASLRPVRSPSWLLAGVPLMSFFVLGFLLAVDVLELSGTGSAQAFWSTASAIAAAAIVWWSGLPATRHAALGRVFD